MDQIGPFFILFGNCCLMPLGCMWLGYAYAKGWIRSPIAVDSDRRSPIDDDPFDDN